MRYPSSRTKPLARLRHMLSDMLCMVARPLGTQSAISGTGEPPSPLDPLPKIRASPTPPVTETGAQVPATSHNGSALLDSRGRPVVKSAKRLIGVATLRPIISAWNHGENHAAALIDAMVWTPTPVRCFGERGARRHPQIAHHIPKKPPPQPGTHREPSDATVSGRSVSVRRTRHPASRPGAWEPTLSQAGGNGS